MSAIRSGLLLDVKTNAVAFITITMQEQVSKRRVGLLSRDHFFGCDIMTENVLAGKQNHKLAAEKLH